MLGTEKKRGPWRQDSLEPRIVLNGAGDFFAIGASVAEASQIVAALNAREQEESARWTHREEPPRILPMRERQT